MSAQHTPGPWRVGADLTGICLERTYAKGNSTPEASTRNGWAKTVAKVTHASWADIGEHVANARLIAAAPDLLAALEGAIGALEQDVDTGADYNDSDWTGIANERLAAARAAIAKALGQETTP